MIRTAAFLLAAVLTVAPAYAGEQYVDDTGYAVSGYDVVAYFDLEQAPPGEPQPLAVPGDSRFTADYNGATFAFSSEANRERFLADPAAYVPAFDGHCAYGIARNGKVPANPHLWRIVDGTLYLNITPQIVEFFEADIDGSLSAAADNWPGLESTPASGNPIPGFSSPAPTSG